MATAPTPRRLSRLPLSPTFRQYVEPIKKDRRKAIVYAVVSITYVYGDRKNVRSVPFTIGTMTGTKAGKITEGHIREMAELAGWPKLDRIHGLIRLRPDKERAGKRLKKRGSRRRKK